MESWGFSLTSLKRTFFSEPEKYSIANSDRSSCSTSEWFWHAKQFLGKLTSRSGNWVNPLPHPLFGKIPTFSHFRPLIACQHLTSEANQVQLLQIYSKYTSIKKGLNYFSWTVYTLTNLWRNNFKMYQDYSPLDQKSENSLYIWNQILYCDLYWTWTISMEERPFIVRLGGIPW